MHKFTDGGYFMHKDNMDICYEILESYDIGNGFTVYATCVNLGYEGNPFVIMKEHKYFISHEDAENFTKLTEKQLKTKRTKSGIPNA